MAKKIEPQSIPIMHDNGTGKQYQYGSITIGTDDYYVGTNSYSYSSGSISLDQLLEKIQVQNSIPVGMKYLIVSCRTSEKKIGTITPYKFDISNRSENEPYILIEAHGTQRDEPLEFDKGNVYFRAPIGLRCRIYDNPEQYDAFMSCISSIEPSKYPIRSTNNILHMKDMKITLRYMTTTQDCEQLKRHGTFMYNYNNFMQATKMNSGLKRYKTNPRRSLSGRRPSISKTMSKSSMSKVRRIFRKSGKRETSKKRR